jgi:hypothetical protein
MGDWNMAEKKTNRLKKIMPNVILIFVLLSTVLILLDVSTNLLNEIDVQTEIVVTPTVQSEPTQMGPTPTYEPIEDA